MKKVIILIVLLFLSSSCVNIHNADYKDIIKEAQSSNLNLSNQRRRGYKYYLPNHVSVNEIYDFNEVIVSKNYKIYMYVDMVSYYNKVLNEYQINENAYFSSDITYNGISGYLEINSIKDKYLIEIMYNYAKIELMVDYDYLKEAITNSIVILSTIKYNDEIIENMMDDDLFNFQEEKLNIFDVTGSESNFLEYAEEFDNYEEPEVPDLDLIN